MVANAAYSFRPSVRDGYVVRLDVPHELGIFLQRLDGDVLVCRRGESRRKYRGGGIRSEPFITTRRIRIFEFPGARSEGGDAMLPTLRLSDEALVACFPQLLHRLHGTR